MSWKRNGLWLKCWHRSKNNKKSILKKKKRGLKEPTVEKTRFGKARRVKGRQKTERIPKRHEKANFSFHLFWIYFFFFFN